MKTPCTLPFLRDQVALFSELDLTRWEAADSIWEEHGMDAARLFFFGA